MKFALYGDGNVGPLDLHASMHPPTEGSKPRFGGIVSRALAPPDAINCAPCLLATSVPPRIKVTTLESQLIHLIQELSGRTLSNVGVYGQGEDSPKSPLPTGNQPGVFGASSDQNGVQGWPNFHTGMRIGMGVRCVRIRLGMRGRDRRFRLRRCGRELAGGLCYVLSLRHDGIAMTARSDKPQIEQRPCRCVLQSMETA